VSIPSERREEKNEGPTEREQRALIERVVKSPFFVGAETRIKLLWYLFEHRKQPVGEKRILAELFDAKTVSEISSGKVRQQFRGLRRALKQYAEADILRGEWRCFLPPVEGNEGYRLRMINLLAEAGAVHGFWHAHLEPVRPVVIVCNEPDFHRDHDADTVVRISHLDTSSEEKDLRKLPEALNGLLPENLTKQLRPCHLYAVSGEIRARDRIAEWFSDEMGIKTEMKFSRDMRISEIAECSPILLGNGRTNKIIRAVTQAHQYSRFAYHVDAEPFGTVEIRGFNERDERERALVEKYKPERSGDSLLLRDNPQRDNVVFSTVTRLPNPYDSDGAITILSAGYAEVLEEIALTLTNGDQMLQLLERTGWPRGRRIPRYFQGLFSVRLGPEDTDAKPAKPKLRCFRHFDRFLE
jgi:hypothetical protein